MKKLLTIIFTITSFILTAPLYAADTCKNSEQIAYFINATAKPVVFNVVARRSSGFYTNDATKSPVTQFTLPAVGSTNLLFCYNYRNAEHIYTELDANNSGDKVIFTNSHGSIRFYIETKRGNARYSLGNHHFTNDTLIVTSTP